MNWLALALAIITVAATVGIVYLAMTYQEEVIELIAGLGVIVIFGGVIYVVVSLFYSAWLWALIKWGWA